MRSQYDIVIPGAIQKYTFCLLRGQVWYTCSPMTHYTEHRPLCQPADRAGFVLFEEVCAAGSGNPLRGHCDPARVLCRRSPVARRRLVRPVKLGENNPAHSYGYARAVRPNYFRNGRKTFKKITPRKPSLRLALRIFDFFSVFGFSWGDVVVPPTPPPVLKPTLCPTHQNY